MPAESKPVRAETLTDLGVILERLDYTWLQINEAAYWIAEIGEYEDSRVRIVPHSGASYLVYVKPAGDGG